MRALNEIIKDAYGERPAVVVTRCPKELRKGLHPHGNWFQVVLPDMTLIVDLPTRPKAAAFPLAYALSFFDEQPTDTKIDLWKRFGPALAEARASAEHVYKQLEV